MFVHTGWAVLRGNLPVTLCNTSFAFPQQNKHCRELIARGDHWNARSLSSSLLRAGCALQQDRDWCRATRSCRGPAVVFGQDS